MTLTEWAVRHGVSQEAVDELMSLIKHDMPNKPPNPASAGAEQYIQQVVRKEAYDKGCMMGRNNVGSVEGYVLTKNDLYKVCSHCADTIRETIYERHIRYGLWNDSSKLNAQIKSSDLIGIRPVLVRPEHVGRTFGVFLAREVKNEHWTYKSTAREKAQKKFIELVIAHGGDASFATGRGTI